MRPQRRGIFLISVLFLTILIAMFLGAAVELVPGSVRRGSNQSDLAAAQRAAASGVQYVLAKLKADPSWKADVPYTITVNDPDFMVAEERGNIVGIVRDGERISQFRIRFNYQNGNPTGANNDDNLVNPSVMTIDFPYVSFNNVPGAADIVVPRADGTGSSVRATPTPYQTLASHSVSIAVEGRCGNALGAATAANLNPTIRSGRLTTTQVETVYAVSNMSQPVVEAAAMSAGNLLAEMPTPGGAADKWSMDLSSSSKNAVGRVRSKGNLTVTGGQTTNLTAKNTGEHRQVGSFSGTAAASVNNVAEQPSDSFYSLKWADVRKATGNALAAGTYVYFDDGSLHYYDMSPQDYYAFMEVPGNAANPGQTSFTLPPTVTSSFTGSGTGLKATMTITGDTLVTSTGNTTAFAVLPAKGVAAGPGAGGTINSGTLASTLISGGGGTLFTQNTYNAGGTSQYTFADPDMQGFLSRVGEFAARVDPTNSSYSAGNWNFISGGGLSTLSGVANLSDSETNYFSSILDRYMSVYPNDSTWSRLATQTGQATSVAQDEIPTVTQVAGPKNITVNFNPSGDSAVLTTPGDVMLGAKLKGNGGSITSEGSVQLLGLGVDFSSTANPEEGVSLYSKKDVLISTYDKAANDFQDVALKGVVYTWGNFKALLGNSSVADGKKWGKFKLTGALIAYGDDPTNPVSSTGKGNIEITARELDLVYDPAYLLTLQGGLPANIAFGRVWWDQR